MSACRGDAPMPDPPVDGNRTVMVYMAADNSINPLASFTDGDLEAVSYTHLDVYKRQERKERVVHVGMYIGNKRFIHSQGDVRVNSFSPVCLLYTSRCV